MAETYQKLIDDLDVVHEDIVYLFENLVRDYTGECKSELLNIIDRVPSDYGFPDEVVEVISTPLRNAYNLMAEQRDKGAGSQQLITSRQRLRDTIWTLRGKQVSYGTMSPIAVIIEYGRDLRQMRSR